MGPEYGYHPNASKTWLIVKEANFEEAMTLFQGTVVSITVEGKRHLGAAIGDGTFVESYVHLKVAVTSQPSPLITRGWPWASMQQLTRRIGS